MRMNFGEANMAKEVISEIKCLFCKIAVYFYQRVNLIISLNL